MNKIRNKHEEPTEWQRFLRNVRLALVGLKLGWQEERTFRQWVIVNIISLILLVILSPGAVFSAMAILAGLLVLAAELLNTSVEATVDYCTQGKEHPLGKLAKDTGGAAVALTVVGLVVVWIFIIWHLFAG